MPVSTICKISIINRMKKAAPVIFLLWLVLAGCAGPGTARLVQPGDAVDIRFLCRLQNGDVVAATDKAVGQDNTIPKSSIFLSKVEDGPVSVTAGSPLPKMPGGKERAFEEEIVDRLAGIVVGMKVGETRQVDLTSEDLPERLPDDYIIRLARIRERPKEMRMPIDEYRSRTSKSPEAGQEFVFDPAVPGGVEAVTPEEVVIRFSARPGDIVQTPLGPGTIKESENFYQIVIDARKGALVRTVHLVGRIVSVDEQFITIDYRHPFGGEPLICDLAVEKIAEIQPANRVKGE